MTTLTTKRIAAFYSVLFAALIALSPASYADYFPFRVAFENVPGDFEGAKEDFDRARPERMGEYLEYLKTKDVGLIANGNHGLLEELAAKHSSVDVQASVAMTSGSDIERFDD